MCSLYRPARQRKKVGMTTLEYFRTPETVLPQELAFGELRVAEAPSASRQRVVRDLMILLTEYVRAQRLGEVLPSPIDVILDFEAALVVQPDIVFVARERAHIVTDRIGGPPDLVIEVLSPRPRIGSLDERVGWFAQHGVRECWLIDLPTRSVVVLDLDEHGVRERVVLTPDQRIPSRVLPGLHLRPHEFLGW